MSGHPLLATRPQRGISLVELLVSIVLGMMLIVVIGQAFLGGQWSSRTMNAMSRMQENTRFVFETLSYDVRMAGFAGCSHSTETNVLNSPGNWSSDLFNQPMVGYEQGVSTFPADISANVLRGDAITVLRSGNSSQYTVANHNPSSAVFQLVGAHNIQKGEILVVTDCSHAAVFQVTNVNDNATTSTVVHNTGASTPGNCTKGLGSPLDCSNSAGTPYTFTNFSSVQRLSATTYYIRANAAGEPALYRQKLSHSGGNAITVAEELAEGVEDMQILYGVDTSTTADQAVDTYVTADQVTVVAPGASNAEKWRRVLSVRMSLLMATRQGEGITTQPQTYTYNGATVTPDDRVLRKVFTTTIALRNRL